MAFTSFFLLQALCDLIVQSQMNKKSGTRSPSSANHKNKAGADDRNPPSQDCSPHKDGIHKSCRVALSKSRSIHRGSSISTHHHFMRMRAITSRIELLGNNRVVSQETRSFPHETTLRSCQTIHALIDPCQMEIVMLNQLLKTWFLP